MQGVVWGSYAGQAQGRGQLLLSLILHTLFLTVLTQPLQPVQHAREDKQSLSAHTDMGRTKKKKASAAKHRERMRHRVTGHADKVSHIQTTSYGTHTHAHTHAQISHRQNLRGLR